MTDEETMDVSASFARQVFAQLTEAGLSSSCLEAGSLEAELSMMLHWFLAEWGEPVDLGAFDASDYADELRELAREMDDDLDESGRFHAHHLGSLAQVYELLAQLGDDSETYLEIAAELRACSAAATRPFALN